MKNQRIKAAFLFLALSASVAACKKDKNQPIPVEQELITTMKLSITDSAGFSQAFVYKIENGFGNTTPGTVLIDTIKLAPNMTYSVTTELLNEKEDPAENITEEILDEKDDHLFIYVSDPQTGAGSISFSNGSKDNNNMPFNQTISFTTGSAGSGKLTVNLMHEATNKNGATPDASGGETDAEAIFPISIQ